MKKKKNFKGKAKMTQGLEILEGMSWVANKIALPLESTPFSTFSFFAQRTKYTADGIIRS